MEYTTRIGKDPKSAHVNYQCPCGCVGGVIYRAELPLNKAGACCCGRMLWVGDDAEARLKLHLDGSLEYVWELDTVTLPWGVVAPTALARPTEAVHGGNALKEDEPASEKPVKDLVCGMMIDPSRAAATSEYKGETYYFCATVCKTKFDSDPKQFVRPRGLLDRLRNR